MAIIHLTKENFDQTIASGLPVLIDFWAVWCMPCTIFSPIVEKAAAELEGRAIIAKINIDEQPDLAEKFSVMSIPSVILLKDGQESGRLSGLSSLEDLLFLLNI